MKLANLVNLKPIQEMASMKARELADSYSLKQLQSRYDQIFRDMEQEAEPEGGPIADQYADELDAYEEALQIAKQKIRGGSTNSGEMTYDQAIAKKYGKSPKGAGPGGPIFESKEKWKALDLSNKAKKELSNKEWNERTTKKLTILKGLNSKGAFKKDWDEEKLQDWVDQNYSWEKVTKQFKNISENIYSEGLSPSDIEIATKAIQDYIQKYKRDADGEAHQISSDIADILRWDDEKRNQLTDYLLKLNNGDDYIVFGVEEGFVMNKHGNLSRHRDSRIHDRQALQVTSENGVVVLITDPRDIGDFITGKGTVHGEDQDGGTVEVHIDSALDYQYVANEGSCGYGPDGVPGDTPGGTVGMDADKRTSDMIRKFIQKEIKKLKEGGEKEVNYDSLEFEGDYHDLMPQEYIPTRGEWNDGTEMTPEELETWSYNNPEEVDWVVRKNYSGE